MVDAWFAEYPDVHRKALVGRFRSPIDDDHHGAFFELFLHHLILVRGGKVCAIEPKLEHNDKSPDFLIENAQGERFYLEAVMATGRSTKENAAHARLNTALAAIDAVACPDHFLDLTVRGMPTAPVSIKKMRRSLQSWIAGLPKYETAKDTPAFKYEEHGATVVLRAWVRNKPGANDARAIGVRHFPVTQIAPSRDVFSALKKKASRYGKLDHPYLVAVNALGLHSWEDAVIDAVLGTPRVRLARSAAGTLVALEERIADGIWFGPPDGRARNTGMSGVLAFRQIDPWNFAGRSGMLIQNPWAARSVAETGLGVDELKVANGAYQRTTGDLMSVLFGLPAIWPEQE